MVKPEGEDSHTGDNFMVRLARKVILTTDYYDGDKTIHRPRRQAGDDADAAGDGCHRRH